MDNVAAAPAAEPVSTNLDPGAVMPSAAGGGVPRATNEAPSLRDSIEAAVKEVSKPEEAKAEPPADEAKADAQPKETDPAKAEKADKAPKADQQKAEVADQKKDQKPEPAARGADGKFAAKDAAEGDGKTKQAEQGLTTAPQRFMPDAKEKWTVTPRPVQRDVENMIREHEAQVTQYRQATERYETIRPFDELARSKGRDLRESLQKVVEFENLLAANPIAGLNRILQEAGPKKADGQPISLIELAQHVVNMGGQDYQRAVSHQPQAQQQGPSEVEKVHQFYQAQLAEAKFAPIIERFASDNPRYQELQNDIAFFLQSGKIPTSLSPEDRLAAAYDMAERINPASNVANPPANDGPDSDRRADSDFSGTKSIKSAPGAITPDVEPERGGTIREHLERALRNQRRA